MLSNISKAELAELAKKMRVATSLPNEPLTRKRKAPTLITQTPTDQDEETTSGLVFKRKRKRPTPHTEHYHSDGRAPHQDIIVIQESEAEISRGKACGIQILTSQLMMKLPSCPTRTKIGSWSMKKIIYFVTP